MPDIKDTVGQGGTNAVHDVALVQVMLKVIKDAKGIPYLPSDYDGKYGDQTKNAIIRFQQDQKLVPPGVSATGEKLGLVVKGSATLKQLNAVLPADYKDVLVLDKTSLVYLPGAATDATSNSGAIAGRADLDAVFRQTVANVVTQMYADHKLVLSLTGSGARRDFARQLKDHLNGAGSPPGESNHQWGRGVDLGFNGLRWVDGDGTLARTDWWLNPIKSDPSMGQAKRDQLWAARNQIAYKTLGLHPTSRKGDDVHMQSSSDSSLSYPRSLANLLTISGKMKWAAVSGHNGHPYKTDFGLGGALFVVGTAKEIFMGTAKVAAGDLVTAIKAAGKDLAKLPVFKDFQFVKDELKAAGLPTPGKLPAKPGVVDGKGIKVTDIRTADVALMQKAIKEDWEAADLNWKKWTPVP